MIQEQMVPRNIVRFPSVYNLGLKYQKKKIKKERKEKGSVRCINFENKIIL